MNRERFSIFDNLIEGIQVIGRDFRYQYINAAAATHGKSTPELLSGKTMMECYFGIEHTPLYEKIKESMQLRIPCKFINQFTFNDGSHGFFDLRIEPIEEGVLIMSFDVSEQKNKELKLDEKLLELEKQLIRVNGQKKQLEDFCHIIAHNMRGPLSNLLLLNTMVQSSGSNEERMLMISKQKPVIDFLNETFDELVNATTVMVDPEVKFDHVNLERSTKKAITLLEGTIIEAGARVSYDFKQYADLYFPEKYLDNIIFNLVENALKYRAPERPLTLDLRSYSKDGHIYLDVKDNGLGIDLVKHGGKIFRLRKTFHPHPHARGFGLFQIKNQLEAIGGTIEVSSLPNVGTTFTVRLNKA
jgi:signal transduction histidine kinase